MGDDITIGVTEIVNNIEVTAQPNDQIVDISVIDNADDVTLNITPTVIEINVNKGSSYAKWGTILGTLSDQTDLQDALDLKADLVDGKVPSSQLPSYVDDVIEVANYAALPATGETGKIYVTIDNNKIFRWTGSTYVEIIDSAAVWGAITGTLSSQTDLQNALNLKANDNVVVKLTGDQSITGSKSFTTNTAAPAMVVTNNSTDNGILLQNTSTGRGITSNNVSTGIGIRSDNTGGGTGISSSNTGAGTGIVSTNTSTTGSALSISNSSTGYGILLTNSTGTGISSSNTGSGTGFYSNNSSTGNGIQSINSSSGYGISSSNTGSGRGIYSSNNSTGDAINIANSGSGRGIYLTNASSGNSLILNNTTAATGMPFTIQKNGTDVFTINDAGEATGVKFIKSGGTSSQFLKADGSIDSTTYQTALTNPVTGSLTTNYLPKATGSTTLGNSLIYDTGTNIGIGTYTPYSATNYKFLTIDGTNGSGYVSRVNSVNSFLFYSNASGSTLSEQRALPLLFETNGSEKMRVTSNGELLIGRTTSYGAGWQLAVEGNIYAKNDLRIDGEGSFGSSVTTTDLNVNRGGGAWQIIPSSGESAIYFKETSTGNVRMTIQGGNVGIGTTSPSEKLSVNGSIGLLNAGTQYWHINSTSGARLDFVRSGVAERMSITSDGNVGIGTTSPVDKLDVNGIFRSIVTSISSTGEIAAKILGYPTSPFGLIFRSYSSGATSIQSQREASNSELFPLLLQPLGGNVGIGTTSPSFAFGSGLHVKSNSGWGEIRIEGQSFAGGTGSAISFTSEGTALADIYADTDKNLSFRTNGASERMRITSGGNVGIGTTSPGGKLHVVGEGIFDDGTNGRLTFANASSQNDIYSTTTSFGFWKNLRLSSNELILSSGGTTERMRITSGGNLCIGTTSTTLSTTSVSAAFGVGGEATLKLGGYGGSTHTQVQFIHTGSVQGSIVTTNGAGTAYNTSSDYRLKEDLKPINGLDLVSQINVYDYKWKSDETRAYGVLAHELQEVVPYAVNGEKDAEEMQSVDYSKLVPILVQAIQDQQKQIDELKTLINK